MWRDISETADPFQVDLLQAEQALKLRSALCQIELKGGLEGFAGSSSEKQALLTTFDKQGVIRWSRIRSRYKLTREGRKRLRLALSQAHVVGQPARQPARLRFRAVPTGLLGIVGALALTYVASLTWLAEGSAFGVDVSRLEAPVKQTSRVEASEPAPVAVSAQPTTPASARIGPAFSVLNEAKIPQQQVAVHDQPAPEPARDTEAQAEAASKHHSASPASPKTVKPRVQKRRATRAVQRQKAAPMERQQTAKPRQDTKPALPAFFRLFQRPS